LNNTYGIVLPFIYGIGTGLPVLSFSFAIATLFLGVLFKGWLPGVEVVKDGSRVELYRSYISGCILLGIAPCTAMVLIWGHLSNGNDGHTLLLLRLIHLPCFFFTLLLVDGS